MKNKNAIDNLSYSRPIWSTFFNLMRKSKLPYLWIALTFALGIVSSRLTLIFPDYTQRIIDGDLSSRTIGVFAIVIVLSGIVSILITYVSGITTAKITKRVRGSIWKEITNIPIHVLEQENAKELISRTTEDTRALSDLLASTLPNIVSSLFLIFGAIFAVSSYHVSFMIVLVILIVVQLIITFILGRINYNYNKSLQLKLAKMTEIISEIFRNIPIVKTFVTEKKEEKRGAEYINDYLDKSFKFQVIDNITMESTQLMNIIGAIVIIVLGAVLVTNGEIEIDEWIAYFMYFQAVQTAIIDIPDNWRAIKASQGSTRRIAELVGQEKEDYESGIGFLADQQQITLDKVKFRYANRWILNDFSLKIPYGKKTVLIGESGAGKSTVLSLLERFYKPESGEIRYGKTNIHKFKLKDWRKAFGYISQDAQLFNGSVYDNITYGIDRKIERRELEEVCQKAGALEFINQMKDGFQTQIGEFGSKLSGGEKQRICIARTILAAPEILLLDEYTANLDLEAEKNIQNTVDEISKGKTTVVIAHRLSTIKEADHIVIVKDGCVIATGRHEELIAKNDIYKNMIKQRVFI